VTADSWSQWSNPPGRPFEVELRAAQHRLCGVQLRLGYLVVGLALRGFGKHNMIFWEGYQSRRRACATCKAVAAVLRSHPKVGDYNQTM
jgi:hypothetical protein